MVSELLVSVLALVFASLPRSPQIRKPEVECQFKNRRSLRLAEKNTSFRTQLHQAIKRNSLVHSHYTTYIDFLCFQSEDSDSSDSDDEALVFDNHEDIGSDPLYHLNEDDSDDDSNNNSSSVDVSNQITTKPKKVVMTQGISSNNLINSIIHSPLFSEDQCSEAIEFVLFLKELIYKKLEEEKKGYKPNNPSNQKTYVFYQKGAWCTEDILLSWLKLCLVPSLEHTNGKAFLIMDNFSAHCTEKVMRFCHQHNIHVLLLPPHTTDRLQPLDISINKPYKKNQRTYALKAISAFEDTKKKKEKFRKFPHYIASSLYSSKQLKTSSFINGFSRMLFKGCLNPLIMKNKTKN